MVRSIVLYCIGSAFSFFMVPIRMVCPRVRGMQPLKHSAEETILLIKRAHQFEHLLYVRHCCSALHVLTTFINTTALAISEREERGVGKQDWGPSMPESSVPWSSPTNCLCSSLHPQLYVSTVTTSSRATSMICGEMKTLNIELGYSKLNSFLPCLSPVGLRQQNSTDWGLRNNIHLFLVFWETGKSRIKAAGRSGVWWGNLGDKQCCISWS